MSDGWHAWKRTFLNSGQFLVESHRERDRREVRKLRVAGKDCVVHDGDVMHFRFNV